MSFNIKTTNVTESTGNHPDVTSWLNTISLVGGSASSTTIAALNTFCNSIDSAGLRGKFYRLNLFCGNNLNSCLVPIYNSVSPNGSSAGFAIDVNTSVVAGSTDFTYSENQGLLGNIEDITNRSYLSRRFLNTGLRLNQFTSIFNNNLHYSIYSKNITNAVSANGYGLGVYDGAVNTGFTLAINSLDFSGGEFPNALLSYSNSSLPKSYPSNKGLYCSTYSNNILNFYEGRGSRLGYRDITSAPIIIPSVSTVSVFAQNRSNSTGALFNFVDYMQGYSIGTSLSQPEIQTYYDIMQTFQTALNRNV